MKAINWDSTLSVQVAEIDDDHHKLVDLFNLLSEANENRESVEYIEAILSELVACTAWHFRHEERLMLKHVYKGLADHHREHEELLESAQQLLHKYHQEKALSDEDILFLEHWLTGHILGADMEMANVLAEVI